MSSSTFAAAAASVAAVVAALAVPGTASAQTVSRDDVLGYSVTVPAGWETGPLLEPSKGLSMTTAEDPGAFCLVMAFPVSDFASRSREELAALFDDPRLDKPFAGVLAEGEPPAEVFRIEEAPVAHQGFPGRTGTASYATEGRRFEGRLMALATNRGLMILQCGADTAEAARLAPAIDSVFASFQVR